MAANRTRSRGAAAGGAAGAGGALRIGATGILVSQCDPSGYATHCSTGFRMPQDSQARAVGRFGAPQSRQGFVSTERGG